MIKQEQKDLADYVKNVHLTLRRKSQQIGAERAWAEHLQNEQILKNYANAMKSLAEDYWSVNNNCGENNTFLCRIQWSVNCIIEYFQNGGLEKEVEKERKKLELFCNQKLIESEKFASFSNCHLKFCSQTIYKLLDVGSCYNPFGKFSFLEVYPIDLFPANQAVKKCNFLEVEVTESCDSCGWFQDNLRKLPSSYFDVVVFSLFLEYLPSPKQRYQACLKAYSALKVNGVLLIITPDSKHATANAPIMKSWKIACAKIGFVRTKLEKLKYLYCMAFRKSASNMYPLLINKINDDISAEEMFIIPQDSVDYEVEEKTDKSSNSTLDKAEVFAELPFS